MMKKFFVVAMALFMVLSCIGCSGTSQGKDTSKTEINAEVNENSSIAIIQKAVGCSKETAKKY